MASMNRVTTKRTVRIAVPRSTQQTHHFICPNLSFFEFFDLPKKMERMKNGKYRVFDRSD
jgi:hypothetical protein